MYLWALDGATGGTLVVEDYSDEFRSRAVTLQPAPGTGGFVVTFARARDRLWLFGLIIVVLVGEWAWRLRRGLP